MKKVMRKVELSDAMAISNIYAPFVTQSATSFEVVPPDADAIRGRILDLRGRYPWLVFEGNGEVLGYAYGSSHRGRPAYQWSVEVTVYLDARAQGRGIGRALYSALFDILRRQGYVNAFAGITLPNPASVGLHESMGFSSIGIFSQIGFKVGQWHDVQWLQLRLREDPAPSDPLSVDSVFSERELGVLCNEYAQSVRLTSRTS